MQKPKAELKFILDETYNTLNNLQPLNAVYQYLDARIKKVERSGKTPDSNLVNCAMIIQDTVAEVQKYKEVIQEIASDYKTEVLDKMNAMEKENIQMAEKIKLQEAELARLRSEVESKDKKMIELVDRYNNLAGGNQKVIDNLNQSFGKINRSISNAVKQIALKEYIQSDEYKNRDRKGAKSPRYRQDIDNNVLANKYKSGVSIKALAEEYNMTENGMRMRLKELGIWEDRRYKK